MFRRAVLRLAFLLDSSCPRASCVPWDRGPSDLEKDAAEQAHPHDEQECLQVQSGRHREALVVELVELCHVWLSILLCCVLVQGPSG